MPDDSSPRRLLRYAPLVAILAAATAGFVLFGDRLSFDTLAENREALLAFRDAHYAATAALFVLAYVLVVALSLPGGTVMTLTGGFLFGTFPGVLYNIGGATLGATLLFLAVRAGLGRHLAQRIDESEGWIRRLKRGIDETMWSTLLLMRLLPAVPFFVANLLPALVGAPLAAYVVTTLVGIAPGALVYTSVGAGLGAVFAAGGRPDLGLLFEPRILLPLLGVAVLAALPLALRLARGRKEP
ncbi:TVP38/TMEM64 family protein [Pseudoroseicyclus aestuarii]|uniref:TVP38/TMEM64 family membrane protein n=1 Tax=Pseudoroseicyclus aestuarii TaxID=1795041 RepID=A0A318SQ10_9RHOB|nr:TVP38/TMEM64 family protein [Pseudoroseicyclus aestuarii]PYE83773.1 putative membrane protein YdjX (TVP38/TMEM64 family) [Pseudoroseicyclus aestuarii]